MKDYLRNSIRALLLVLAVLLSLPVFSKAVEIEGINYELETTSHEAKVVAKRHGQYAREIAIPETIEHNAVTYRVTAIGNGAFSGCTELVSVVIPNTVTNIEGWAFYYCTSLSSVAIPNSVKCIEEETFRGCSALRTIDIPDSVTTIGRGAFMNCEGLHSVVIPNCVTTISHNAFYGCTALSSVAIGCSAKEIGTQAFAHCPRLKDVFCHAASAPKANSQTFDKNASRSTSLHVPGVSVENYKATMPWSTFASITPLPAEDSEQQEM